MCAGVADGPFYLGHEFPTDALLLRLRVSAPGQLGAATTHGLADAAPRAWRSRRWSRRSLSRRRACCRSTKASFGLVDARDGRATGRGATLPLRPAAWWRRLRARRRQRSPRGARRCRSAPRRLRLPIVLLPVHPPLRQQLDSRFARPPPGASRSFDTCGPVGARCLADETGSARSRRFATTSRFVASHVRRRVAAEHARPLIVQLPNSRVCVDVHHPLIDPHHARVSGRRGGAHATFRSRDARRVRPPSRSACRRGAPELSGRAVG